MRASSAFLAVLCGFGSCSTPPPKGLVEVLGTEAKSTVRVLIAIDVQIERESWHSDPYEQRSEIKAYQADILAELAGHFDPNTLTQYRTLPALALDLYPDGHAALRKLVRTHNTSPNLPDLEVVRDPRVRQHMIPGPPIDEAMALTRIDTMPGNANGSGQTLVVIDDGVSESFDVLAGKIVHGGFVTSNETSVCNGVSGVTSCFHDKADGAPLGNATYPNHGTQVAAIACGTIGVAPGAQCFAIRVADSQGIMLYSDVVYALDVFYTDWSDDFPASVVNLSLGVSKLLFDTVADCNDFAFGALTRLACLNLIDKNIPVVVSAGNDGSSTAASFPGCLEEVITVGATTKCVVQRVHERSPASNWGPLVDISAPGANIIATVEGMSFGMSPGTSIAAPQVAGLLLRLRQAHPDCDYEFLRRAVLESSAVAGPVGNRVAFLDGTTALALLDSLCPNP